MTTPVRDTQAMIAAMDPVLDKQLYCFVSPEQPGAALELMRHALATFREDEGLSLIVPAREAANAGIDTQHFARIILLVHSDLEGFGLTAAVSGVLAEAGIACNVVAALRHDHLFVPARRADEALALLRALQERSPES
ncbi:ACT domain-containing protein [Altererythrobacter sp. MF3-039]|uniref:ACT domain-containing protein n=1 Tax=Altererythrobacter sp. MF3-039 TaxID=3252901 RepID=UPI00390CB4F1